jgi:hypothetical protein
MAGSLEALELRRAERHLRKLEAAGTADRDPTVLAASGPNRASLSVPAVRPPPIDYCSITG